MIHGFGGTTVTFPILVECVACHPREADGFIFRPKRKTTEGTDWFPVRVVPFEELEAVQKHEAPGEIKTPLGSVSQRDRANLRILNILVEAVQSGDDRALSRYVKLASAKAASAEVGRIKNVLDFDPNKAIVRRSPDPDHAWMGNLFGPLRTLAIGQEHKRLETQFNEQARARITSAGVHAIPELIRELNRLANARLVLWWQSKNRQLAAGLFCRTFPSALYALLLSRTSIPEGTAFCARCGKPFTRVRVGQIFCSKRCGFAGRKARQRARGKGESQ